MPRRVLQGTVVSNKMDKTAVVRVERRMKHPLFGKFITKSKKYHAHDENNTAAEGQFVSIMECAPISKNKRFTLVDAEANQAKPAKAAAEKKDA